MSQISTKLFNSFKAHSMMWICCLVMMLPLIYFIVANRGNSEFWKVVSLAAPMFLCVGAHFVLHKFMGKSCHSSEDKGQLEKSDANR